MKELIHITKLILLFASIFHVITSIVWLVLSEGEKSMFRADMALVFFALYVILRKIENPNQV